MLCHEFASSIDDHIAGKLPAGVELRFEIHGSRCSACTEDLVAQQEAIRLVRSAYDGPREAPLPEELVGRILASIGRL